MSNNLKEQVYIVTGSSKGFGLAIATSLVKHGAKVGLLGRNVDSLNNAVTALGNDNAFAVTADVTSSQQLLSAFNQVAEHFGRLDGLVNNAGMARPGKIASFKQEEVLLQVNTNFLGTVFACQAVLPLLQGSDNPRIINISSASAYHQDEMSHLSIYASTKAAVERFTRDLATECQADEIGVTCIRPGAAGTAFAEGWDDDALIEGLEAWIDAGAYMCIGMEAEQVGEAVAFALAQPRGVAVDLLEIRPNRRIKKT